jgi:hypothetical protein
MSDKKTETFEYIGTMGRAAKMATIAAVSALPREQSDAFYAELHERKGALEVEFVVNEFHVPFAAFMRRLQADFAKELRGGRRITGMNTTKPFYFRLSPSTRNAAMMYFGSRVAENPVELGRALRKADDNNKSKNKVPAPTLADRRALVEAWLESPELTEADVDAVMSGYEGDAE